MSEIVSTLRSEMNNLEQRIPELEKAVVTAQLALREHTEKRERIRDLLRLYDSSSSVQPPRLPPWHTMSMNPREPVIEDRNGNVAIGRGPPPPLPLSVPETPPKDENPPTTKKALMVKVISEFLTMRGSAHRSEILSHLESKGIGLGSNPVASLAAFMSTRRNLFISDGRGTFTMSSILHGLPPSPKGAGSAEAATPSPKLEAAFNLFNSN